MGFLSLTFRFASRASVASRSTAGKTFFYIRHFIYFIYNQPPPSMWPLTASWLPWRDLSRKNISMKEARILARTCRGRVKMRSLFYPFLDCRRLEQQRMACYSLLPDLDTCTTSLQFCKTRASKISNSLQYFCRKTRSRRGRVKYLGRSTLQA